MSPILVRPVREQLEHDRVIRLLQAKYKRKFDVAINPGNEQGAPVVIGTSSWYPDLVLNSTERNRKLVGVVEVETVESVNHLEAMSQWAAFARLKVAFSLYVPAAMVDVARRHCVDQQIAVTEIWAYHTIGDQIRFTAVQRAAGADDKEPAASAREPRRTKIAPVAPVAKPGSPRSGAAAKPAPGKTASTRTVAAKPVRRPAAPPARKKAVRSAKAPKPVAKSAARKPAARAPKRK